MNRFDGVLIPGGGFCPDGTLPLWTQRRLEQALYYPQARYFIPLSAGSTHKPSPLNAQGFPLLESVVAGEYLCDRGIPAERILTEASSYDTIGNAFFARIIHTDIRRLHRLLVITSEFHRARTQAIFEWIFGLDSPDVPYQLTFISTANDGIAADALAARVAKEAAGLARVKILRSRLQNLAEVHQWLYSEHAAYALGKAPSPVLTKAIDTY